MGSTLTEGTPGADRAVPVLSWGVLAVVTALGGLSAVYVAAVPAAEQTPLNERVWQDVVATDPEAASIVARLLVVLGLLGIGFGLMAVLVTLLAYRRGARWAWWALWLVPLVYGAIAARQLVDAYPIGWFYAGLAVIGLAGLAIPVWRRPR